MYNKLFDKKCKLDNSLYIVPTPIGNMQDITIRALQVIETVDVLYCENISHTKKLLDYYGIRVSKLETYNDHSCEKTRNKIIEFLHNGKIIGLVSDGGTPMICDPGYKLVKLVIENGYDVVSLPGACAFVTGLVASGFAVEEFVFKGFLPNKKQAVENQFFNDLKLKKLLIYYDSPKRILNSLNVLNNMAPKIKISVCRELTKTFESYYNGTPNDVLNMLNDAFPNGVKGEIVLIVCPQISNDITDEEIIFEIKKHINLLSTKDCAYMVSTILGVNKKHVYSLVNELKQ